MAKDKGEKNFVAALIRSEVLNHVTNLGLRFFNPKVREAALVLTDNDIGNPELDYIRSSGRLLNSGDCGRNQLLQSFMPCEVAPTILTIRNLDNFCESEDWVRITSLNDACYWGLHQICLGMVDLNAVKDVAEFSCQASLGSDESIYEAYRKCDLDFKTNHGILFKIMTGLDTICNEMLYGPPEDGDLENTQNAKIGGAK